MVRATSSLKDRIFLTIADNPGILRTEVRDKLGLQNNVSGPAIKELIDSDMIIEGPSRVSMTTGKPGKSLYVAGDWAKELDSQNKLFD